MLLEDGRSTVSLPGSLLGSSRTGGLTRLVDKRRVRPDWSTPSACRPEGALGEQRADGLGAGRPVVPASRASRRSCGDRARPPRNSPRAAASAERRTGTHCGGRSSMAASPIPIVRVEFDEAAGDSLADHLSARRNRECFAPEPGPKRLRSRWWPLAVCRELDDALLLLRGQLARGRRAWSCGRREMPSRSPSADVALTSGSKTTGSSARSSSPGGGPSSTSTSPGSGSWLSSSPAAASSGPCSSWRWPPTVSTWSTPPPAVPRSRRPRSSSPVSTSSPFLDQWSHPAGVTLLGAAGAPGRSRPKGG